MPYCDQKKAIFLHIPKTGGTTIKGLLKLPKLSSSDPSIRPSPQHLTCALLKDKIGQEKYEAYYKFTFIRNPWARILSTYYWRQTLPKKREVLPFDEFIQLVEHTVRHQNYYELEFGDHFIPQTEYIEKGVDVFKYEHLSTDITSIASKLGLPKPHIPDKKVKPHDAYWNYYSPSSKDIIANIYDQEIKTFEYKFGE